MSHYHHFIEGICENCGERKIDIDLESAERAIVVAADMWFDADQDCSWEDKSEALAAAVGAWRKLRGER